MPNGCFINAMPNGSFINARPWPFYQSRDSGWPDLQISATNCIFAIIPHNQFISGRAKLFSSKSRPNGRFINARPNGRFNNGWAIFSKSLPNGCFINARPNGRFINAKPNGRFIKAETTDGQTSRFQPQIGYYLSAGSSCFQHKPAQWPLCQWEVQWPFYQRQAQWPA